jgi:uncharacterized membrane protein YhaH (DUF805 family)
MEYMLMPLRRYFDFNGRSRRKEYWMWFLFVIIGAIVFSILDTVLGLGGTTNTYSDFDSGASVGFNSTGGILSTVFMLAILIPNIAVGIRRLHDTDKSGWWILIGLIPLVGAIVLIVFFVSEGTRGPNRFGSDPKSGAPDQVFA